MKLEVCSGGYKSTISQIRKSLTERTKILQIAVTWKNYRQEDSQALKFEYVIHQNIYSIVS